MSKSLTIAYVTARREPHIEWFYDSLTRQISETKSEVSLIVVDSFASQRQASQLYTVEPKPTVWQGRSRLTKEDWWAMSNARNTAICHCKTDWIVFLDDRSLLMPGWLKSVREAMKYGYAVAGTYEKVHNLVVEDGLAKSFTQPKDDKGNLTGIDTRSPAIDQAFKCPGEWFFGGSVAAPLEWMLQINGYDETCDGLSMEDVICGLMLQNNGYPVCYDRRMKILEDRTPSAIGERMKREDKGKSPDDKSHAMLNMLRGLKRSMHQWNLRQIRDDVLAGNPFPPATFPIFDWYDGQPLCEM